MDGEFSRSRSGGRWMVLHPLNDPTDLIAWEARLPGEKYVPQLTSSRKMM